MGSVDCTPNSEPLVKVDSSRPGGTLTGLSEEERTMGQGRVFSREFKVAAVRQVASGAKRPAQICREHGVAESVLLRWRHEYEARGDGAFTPRQPTAAEALERKVAELERFCGQLALENAALKQALSTLPSRNGTR